MHWNLTAEIPADADLDSADDLENLRPSGQVGAQFPLCIQPRFSSVRWLRFSRGPRERVRPFTNSQADLNRFKAFGEGSSQNPATGFNFDRDPNNRRPFPYATERKEEITLARETRDRSWSTGAGFLRLITPAGVIVVEKPTVRGGNRARSNAIPRRVRNERERPPFESGSHR